METEIKGINEKLDNHTDQQRIDFKNLNKKLDNMVKQFAGKWVEKLTIASLVAMIAALVTLIIQTRGGI